MVVFVVVLVVGFVVVLVCVVLVSSAIWTGVTVVTGNFKTMMAMSFT